MSTFRWRPATDLAGATEGGIAWPDLSDTISPPAKPELRALGVQDLGTSLRRQRLVGAEPGPRTGVEVPATVVHGKFRRHRHYRRARSSAASGQHADLLSGSRVLTALLITSDARLVATPVTDAPPE